MLHILKDINRKLDTLMANTDALTTAVTANTEAVNKAVATLTQPNPQPAIDAATTQIEANTSALTAAEPVA